MAKLGKNQDPRCVYSNDELCAWASAEARSKRDILEVNKAVVEERGARGKKWW